MKTIGQIHNFAKGLLSGIGGFALPLMVAESAQAQAYGPRQFLPAPSGTNAVIFQFKSFDTNTALDTSIVYPNLDVETNAFVFSYTRNFSIGDTSGQIVVTQPIAVVDAQGSLGDFSIGRSNTGLADTQVEFRVGILGSPGVDLEEYVQYLGQENPDVVMKGMVNVTFPTGDYSTDQVVNIGSNRFAFRAGLPTTINLGPNWAPGNRTLLEIIPAANFYTRNDNPPFPDSRFGSDFNSQDPLFTLESHLSTDLGPQFFASLDAYYVNGGGTSTDGASNNNGQSWLGLGGTVGGNLWDGGTLSLSYGGVVAGNDNSPNGTQFNLYLLQSF